MTRPDLADIVLGFFVAAGIVSAVVQVFLLFGVME